MFPISQRPLSAGAVRDFIEKQPVESGLSCDEKCPQWGRGYAPSSTGTRSVERNITSNKTPCEMGWNDWDSSSRLHGSLLGQRKIEHYGQMDWVKLKTPKSDACPCQGACSNPNDCDWMPGRAGYNRLLAARIAAAHRWQQSQ